MILYNNLTDEQIIKISRLCAQEQGTVAGSAAEASLMANLLEGTESYLHKYGKDLYSFVRNSGWFSRAAYWMDNGKAGDNIISAVRAVLVDGKRALPSYVNEHDCFSDIISAANNGAAINIRDRAAYIKDVTRIKNRYGSAYTFYCFPDSNSDPFGYTKKEEHMEVTASAIIAKARYYIGYLEKKSPKDLEDFKANAGSGNFTKFQPEAGAGNGDEWCQYFVDAMFVEVGGSIKEARRRLWMGGDGEMTGYTPEAKNYYTKVKQWISSGPPQPGDQVFFFVAGKGRVGHTGLVVWVDTGKKTFGTVEGNTRAEVFSSDGGCVAEHEYSYEHIGGTNRVNGFGRPLYDADRNGGWTKNMNERTYISGLYPDELYRAASDKEIDHWQEEIRKGKTYDNVLSGIRNSEEGMRAWIERCYRMMLYRAPDPEGMKAWMKAMKAGKTREAVMKGFMDSPEYHKLHDKN